MVLTTLGQHAQVKTVNVKFMVFDFTSSGHVITPPMPKIPDEKECVHDQGITKAGTSLLLQLDGRSNGLITIK